MDYLARFRYVSQGSIIICQNSTSNASDALDACILTMGTCAFQASRL